MWPLVWHLPFFVYLVYVVCSMCTSWISLIVSFFSSSLVPLPWLDLQNACGSRKSKQSVLSCESPHGPKVPVGDHQTPRYHVCFSDSLFLTWGQSPWRNSPIGNWKKNLSSRLIESVLRVGSFNNEQTMSTLTGTHPIFHRKIPVTWRFMFHIPWKRSKQCFLSIHFCTFTLLLDMPPDCSGTFAYSSRWAIFEWAMTS